MTTQREISDFGRRLATEFRPHKVVLFGSYAYGHPGPNSDVDLLVVMPLDGNPVDKSVEMRLKLRPRFPLDLLVRTPAKIKERLAMGDDFIRDILDKGKVLYEAPGRYPGESADRGTALRARFLCRSFRKAARQSAETSICPSSVVSSAS